ncbi:MAG: response regulator [Desulfosalsimonas sp.]|uniref:ATP-binding response regulator n=1 Tax=Desulfosalsimonas sp. TaxID=3073848 RepID=UPI003970D5DE
MTTNQDHEEFMQKPSRNPDAEGDITVRGNVEEIFFQPRVLVIDDEERIRDACDRMLTEDGFEVACACNGEDGLQLIQEAHFDIILLDLMMAGLSGFEVLTRVKSLHPDTVIIVITGYATIEHSIEAMKKGAFDFLPKPFSPEDLRLVVRKAIEFIRTLQDISTEKSRMRVLINLLADGVLTTDNQKKVALANPAFLKMIGSTRTNVQGCPVDEIVTDSALLEMIDQALGQPSGSFAEITEEIRIKGDSEDKETILGATCIPFRDRLNRNLGTVTVLNDITTLKHLDQVKSDFVSMVAHEIKSPLNSVLMLLDNVKSGLAGEVNEKQTEILGRVTERIKSLTSLSAELLDLAKIESGLIHQEREEVDIAALMAEQADLYRPKAEAGSIDMQVLPVDGPVTAMGNRTNLCEVMANLISNAIRYTPEGGQIRISAGVEDNFAVFSVADTGFGIDPEEKERIFQRFYRVKTEQTRPISGTGLGLAIVKSIVEAHHGRIQVDSQPGQGSTFRVYLPRMQM